MEKMDVSDPGLWSPQGYSHPPRWPFGTMDDFPVFWRRPCLQLARHRDILAACCNRKRCRVERRDSKTIFAKGFLDTGSETLKTWEQVTFYSSILFGFYCRLLKHAAKKTKKKKNICMS